MYVRDYARGYDRRPKYDRGHICRNKIRILILDLTMSLLNLSGGGLDPYGVVPNPSKEFQNSPWNTFDTLIRNEVRISVGCVLKSN